MFQHPQSLVRDTSCYRPLMTPVGNKYYKRKLSILSQEELGIPIQNNQSAQVGHSSIEDASSTLLIYMKHQKQWEQYLHYPLRTIFHSISNTCHYQQTSFIHLYLDGCNLPLGLRRTKTSHSSHPSQTFHKNNPSFEYQLISKTIANGTTEIYSSFDWIPVFQSLLIKKDEKQKIPPHTQFQFENITIMYDGAMYRNCPENKRPKQLFQILPNLYVETTDIGVQVDDILVQKCQRSPNQNNEFQQKKNIVPIQDVIQLFHKSSSSNDRHIINKDIALAHGDHLAHYIIVRRKAGGSRTHKRLFSKLNLRRPNEGALCLTALSPRLQKHSYSIAKELEKARVHNIIEYEIRKRSDVSSVVITNDILLADRLVKLGVIVLNYKQMQQFI